MADMISPSAHGYRPGHSGTEPGNGYGRTEPDLNPRPSEPRDEEAVACARCGQLPNDVLILTCDHNLCLRCASDNLRAQNEKAAQGDTDGTGQNSFQTVICDICHIATVLDPGSATELLTMNHGDGGRDGQQQDMANKQGEGPRPGYGGNAPTGTDHSSFDGVHGKNGNAKASTDL